MSTAEAKLLAAWKKKISNTSVLGAKPRTEAASSNIPWTHLATLFILKYKKDSGIMLAMPCYEISTTPLF